jgi:non-heme chloroperoxidase
VPIAPLTLKAQANPGGTPIEVFDELRDGVRNDRAQFFEDPSAPLYGANRPGANVNHGLRDSSWLQAVLCGLPAAYECATVFTETDQTEDLEKFGDLPTWIIQGTTIRSFRSPRRE